jgi:addiction module RelB/DinJ family antitoxin
MQIRGDCMQKTVSVNVRLDPKLKKKAEDLCDNIGIPVTSAITIFLNKFVDSDGFPFAVTANSKNSCPICENHKLKPEIEEELLQNDDAGENFSTISELFEDLESGQN